MGTKAYFAGLDLVRCAAAFLVLFYHFTYASWMPGGTAQAASLGVAEFKEVSWFSSAGWVGVQIFFVISGFVIAQSAEEKTARQFGIGRIRRLFPSILICASVTALVAFAFDVWSADSLARRYFATLVLWPVGPWIDGVYWTLTIEAMFYAAIFLLVAGGKVSCLEEFAVLLGSISAIYLLAVSKLGFHSTDLHSFWRYGCYFALGMMLWIIVSQGVRPRRLFIAAVFVGAGLLEISGAGLPGAKALGSALWIVSLVVICATTYWRVPGNDWTRRVGLMTYPLYLVHQLVGSAILRLTPWTGKYVALAVAIAATASFAWFVVDVEKPLWRAMAAGVQRVRQLRSQNMPT